MLTLFTHIHTDTPHVCTPIDLCPAASIEPIQELLCMCCLQAAASPPPTPSTHMHPSHPHQGPARAEGPTCTLGMAVGTTTEFLLPSHSSFALSLLKTLLPLRETHLHMCSSFSSSLTKSLLVLVGTRRHLAASQATNITSRSSSAHWLSSSQSMRAAPGSKGGCPRSSTCKPLSSSCSPVSTSLHNLVASRL